MLAGPAHAGDPLLEQRVGERVAVAVALDERARLERDQAERALDSASPSPSSTRVWNGDPPVAASDRSVFCSFVERWRQPASNSAASSARAAACARPQPARSAVPFAGTSSQSRGRRQQPLTASAPVRPERRRGRQPARGGRQGSPPAGHAARPPALGGGAGEGHRRPGRQGGRTPPPWPSSRPSSTPAGATSRRTSRRRCGRWPRPAGRRSRPACSRGWDWPVERPLGPLVALQASALVERDGDRYTLTDPLFEEWIAGMRGAGEHGKGWAVKGSNLRPWD